MNIELNHALVFEKITDAQDLSAGHCEDEQAFDNGPYSYPPSVLICDCFRKRKS